jgi:hypothetical protein
MTATTYSNFNEKTESLEVAEKLADQILGKTILVTGVNLGGIGFTTAKAFVLIINTLPLQLQLTILIGFSISRSSHHSRSQHFPNPRMHRCA